jgi:hypothetical protein
MCKSVKKDGSPCKATPATGREYCFFHDPDPATREQAKAARACGGRQGLSRVLPNTEQAFELRTASDVVGFLSTTVNDVRCGRVDARVGNCLGYLAGVVLKALESSELEERVKALEEKLSLKKRVA